jgi:cob(I)alamin adenosyltransferase
MTKFYTRTGDDGYTSLLGEGRLPKHHPRMEAIGNIDEASATLGAARAFARDEKTIELLITAQRDLYQLMAEIAATPVNAERFRTIDANKVTWLEKQTDQLSVQIPFPKGFILPGDSPASGLLAMARTVVRRAERRVAFLLHGGEIENPHLLHYLNRLSSMIFLLELLENRAAGVKDPTMAESK